jgi:hypothetical protein
MVLNEGQRTNFRVVRVALGTSLLSWRGQSAGVAHGGVSDLPPSDSQKNGFVCRCAVSSVLSSLPASVWTTWDLPNQGKANLHLLWWQRWQLTAKVGELGYNVLVLDTDIAIHSDPYPHLKVTTRPYVGYSKLVGSKQTRVENAFEPFRPQSIAVPP